MSKYRAVRTTVDSITFASKKEARRYGELRIMQMAKLISGLELQPRYPLTVNGYKICTYLGDFSYYDKGGKFILEDVKSEATKTRVYKIKKNLLLALTGIEITEV